MRDARAWTHEQLRQWAEGLRVAKGDRLVDVVGTWGFRITAEENPRQVITYAQVFVPAFQRLLEDESSDMGLRAVVAETLVAFGLALERVIGGSGQAQEESLSAAIDLRAAALRALRVCFDRPTAFVGRLAIAAALERFIPTNEVLALAQAALDDAYAPVREAVPRRFRPALSGQETPPACR